MRTTEKSEMEDVLSGLALPTGAYSAVVPDQMRSPQEWPPRIVVWTDRPYDTCPSCNQHVARDMSAAMPVQLSQGNLEAYSQQHGCGQWLDAPWEAVRGTGDGHEVTQDDVLRVADELAESLSSTRQSQRDEIKARLRKELAEALRRLDEPLGEGEAPEERAAEVRTGSEVEPGIYRDGHWLAWDYDPGAPEGSGDLVEVHEDEARETGRV